MNIGRIATTLAVTTFFAFPLYLSSRSNGTAIPLGRTGGPFPGEQTCGTANCHNNMPNSGPSDMDGVSLSVNGAPISDYEYTPGETVALQVRVADPEQGRWGFQLTARPEADVCANAGSLEPGEQVLKRTSTSAIGSCDPGLEFVVHAFPKMGAEGLYDVTWTAPDNDIGPIIFASAGNAANGNNSRTGDHIYTTQATVTAAAVEPLPKPIISDNGVVLANLLPKVESGSPLSIMSAFGSEFASEGTNTRAELDSEGRITTNLAGTCVEINGERSAMFFLNSGQVNFQASHAVDAMGPASVVVLRGCDTPQESRSDPMMIDFAPVSPGFFMFGFDDAEGANPIAALHNDADSTPVGEPGLFPNSTPAAPGELISFFATGFGPTDPSFEVGQIPGVGAELVDKASAKVMIGGIELAPADISYIGVSPCCAGQHQLVARIPSLEDGDHEVIVEVGGVSTPAGPFVTVANP